MKIAFVILNYNTYEETKNCVQSIEEKLDTKDYKIVIVDNCSADDSADRLAEFIKGKTQAELIRNQENMGFARGNNVGIAYVNQKYRPEYVAVCNSDTELISENLVFLLDNEYEKSGFALLGPLKIQSIGKCGSNRFTMINAEQCKELLKEHKKEELLVRYRLNGIYDFFNRLSKWVLRKLHNSNISDSDNEFYKYRRQVVLHGFFLVFSKKAFDYIEGFDNRTFLFYEEELLYLSLIKHNLVTVYDPEIVVYHIEGGATKKIKPRQRERILFTNKYLQESARILLEELEKTERTGKSK